jgi:hypothetical protein
MEFDPVWTGCFDMTDAEFYALAAPFVTAYALMLGIGIGRLVHRRPARLTSLLRPDRSRSRHGIHRTENG